MGSQGNLMFAVKCLDNILMGGLKLGSNDGGFFQPKEIDLMPER